MFLFVVPLTPTTMRTSIHEELWRLTKKSLLEQECKNWKAIILGSVADVEVNEHFIYIEADNFTKVQKLSTALDYIANHPEIKPKFLIRLDADDVICSKFLNNSERLAEKYDLFYDSYHACIDPVYMKISYRKNEWVPNTAIHRYEYAITKCGPKNEVLFLQDHDYYWLQYYSDKRIYRSRRVAPLYYRILTPYSITSSANSMNGISWAQHLHYLNGYGPWIPLKSSFKYYIEIRKICDHFQKVKPNRPPVYWVFNFIKHRKNLAFNISNKRITSPILETAHSVSASKERTCTRCILSTSDTPHIRFDRNGVCTYCNYYDYVTAEFGTQEQKTKYLENKIQEIKARGKGKEYDCIIGVSGGVDSSYLAYWANLHQLRPLIVHFDNGWNSELAVKNIERLCSKLGYGLQTYVIDWEEFKQLQLAYLRAGVIDIEMLTDHAIIATIYKIAKKYNIKYTLNGFNYATEAVMPKGWVFDKTDFTNIKDINDKFGKGKIKSFPHLTFVDRFLYSMLFKIESIRVLNYIDYNKKAAKELLQSKLGWRDYGGKHYESIFTKFYQAYILPVKFGVDKRRAHLSNLICSGEITRSQALEVLKEPLYDPVTLKNEKEYILKKLGMSEEEFDKLMKEKPRSHKEFRTQEKLWNAYFKFIKILRPWKT